MKTLPLTRADQRTPLPKPFVISKALDALLSVITAAGGHGILVGGCVRDHLLGLLPQDLDIEVYGLSLTALKTALEKHFKVIEVGRAFGIFKVMVLDESFDVALPRRENKEGFGHKGFVIDTDPTMSFIEAASRRDFTINAMGIDVQSQELLDAHEGLNHLHQKRLKHVSPAFVEDPLRVLRAAQFGARFSFILDPETVLLCQALEEELKTLSRERIFEEMKKLLFAQKPSLGFIILHQTKALSLFPELAAMIDCPQDPLWHPEGDVWIHTLMVIDQAARLTKEALLDEEQRLIVMAGALCHDVGKPPTTKEIDGRIRSLAHDEAGVPLTESLLSRMAFPPRLIPEVSALVKEHLKPYQLYKTRDEVSDGAIKRLTLRVNIDRLLLVSQADFFGRTTEDALSGVDPSCGWLKDKITHLLGNEKAPKPILQGRHLIALGYKPGPLFSEMLNKAFEAQLDGAFATLDEALIWFKKQFGK